MIFRFFRLLALGGLLAGSFSLKGGEDIFAAEDLLREEMVARELLATEKREWSEEKDWMERRMALLEREKESLAEDSEALEAQLAEVRAALEESRMDHREILRERENLQEYFAEEGPLLAELIQNLPLRKSPGWERPVERLRRSAEGVGEEALLPTMRAYLALLQDLDRRDGSWQRERNLIQLPGESAERELEVLWMGLAHAWFRSPEGDLVGRGYRDAEGSWVWQPLPEERDEIARLFAIHAGREAARWILVSVGKEGVDHE